MKKIYIALVLALPLAGIHPTVNAQQEGGGYNESVVVKGSYTPVIELQEKLNFPTTLADTQSRTDRHFQYSISPTRMKALYEPTRIRAARIVGEPTTRLYNNYLRLGMGNYWSPLADLYWNSTRDRKKTYGVRLNHRSSWDKLAKLPEYGPLQMNRTGITLFGKYIVGDVLQLSTDLSYEHDHNLYYGFTDSTLQAKLNRTRDDINLDDYRASYNIATWNIGIRNMELDPNRLGYAANVHLSDLWALWGQNEINLNLSGDVHYGFNLLDTYKGVAYLHMEWDGYTHSLLPTERPLGYLAGPSTDTVRGFRNIVKVNPYADFMFSGLQFHAGFTAGWDAFTTDTATTFRFFPDVVVSKSFLHDNLVLSLGATGGFDANSWNTLRQVNPYIAPGSEQRATRHYDFAGHIRWSFSKKLEANIEASYQMLRDDLTFRLDTLNYALQNVYRPHYFANNRFSVGGTVTFVNDEMLTLRAGGHYYAYTLGDDSVLYYRPKWDALLAANVNYHNKWFFHLEGQLLGSMTADFGETLPMRYGIAAEVEYRHNRALSFFLRGDNLAFQRYWLWSNYPSQRGLILVGLTYTIPHK